MKQTADEARYNTCKVCHAVIGTIAGAEHLSDPDLCRRCMNLWLAGEMELSEELSGDMRRRGYR